MHRRRHGRVRTLGLTTHLYTGGKLASSLPVENLSLGGAFLRTLIPIKVGTAIGLNFFCPGRPQPLAVAGKVATALRSEAVGTRGAAGLGVAFDPLTPDQEAWLRKLLLAHAPGPALLEGDPPLNPPAPKPTPPPPGPYLSDLPEPGEAPRSMAGLFSGPGAPMVPEVGRLMIQVKGLLMQVADWQQRADSLEKAARALQAENERLRAALTERSGRGA